MLFREPALMQVPDMTQVPDARFAWLLAVSLVCIDCSAHWQSCTGLSVQAQPSMTTLWPGCRCRGRMQSRRWRCTIAWSPNVQQLQLRR